MLHSGHVAFFEEASRHGDLYVGLGSDKTIYELKARTTINTEQERLYMVNALKFVKEAWINSGSGVLDFKKDLIRINPDVLFVNEDGHSTEKERLCADLGIEYIISKRIPADNLPIRSTTALRQECHIPYRIDLAGGWLDQPYVSEFYPGPVVTISIEPDYEFNDRSGMSTSTRKKAIELWQSDIPEGNKEKLAKVLFCYENPPGSEFVSGSQDAIGIVFPGVNYLWYDKKEYWPSYFDSIKLSEVLNWLEERIYLFALQPRLGDFNVIETVNITSKDAERLANASIKLWEATQKMDSKAFGEAMTESFNAQIAMFPLMINHEIENSINKLPNSTLGYKLSGAGGGGYLVLFSEVKIENALKIRIRR